MAKGFILRFLFRLPILPLISLSKLAYFFNWRGFRRDIDALVTTVDTTALLVPEVFSDLLFVAEDHRSKFHPGVDPIALVRAAWVWLRWRRREGGSTVEQQFVRTVLGMHARVLSRKIHEQLLALTVSRIQTKPSIARAYLACAYYGTQYTGMAGLKALCGNNLDVASPEAIRGAIARLKYPEPRHPSVTWLAKNHRRIEYIAQRQAQLSGHSSGHSLDTHVRLTSLGVSSIKNH